MKVCLFFPGSTRIWIFFFLDYAVSREAFEAFRPSLHRVVPNQVRVPARFGLCRSEVRSRYRNREITSRS